MTPSDVDGDSRGVLSGRTSGSRGGGGPRPAPAARITTAQVLNGGPFGPRGEISPAFVERWGAGVLRDLHILPNAGVYY